jgi:hypothetical protein
MPSELRLRTTPRVLLAIPSQPFDLRTALSQRNWTKSSLWQRPSTKASTLQSIVNKVDTRRKFCTADLDFNSNSSNETTSTTSATMPSLKQSLKRYAKKTAQRFLNCVRKTSRRNSDPISSSLLPRPRIDTAVTEDGLVPSGATTEVTSLKATSPPSSPGLVPSDADVTALEDTSSPSSYLSMTDLFSKHLEACAETFTESTNSSVEPQAEVVTTTNDSANTHVTLQMTLDLPAKIQKAALAQRAFESLERKVTAERSNVTELEMELQITLSNQQGEVDRLEKIGATEAEIEQARTMLFRLHVLVDEAQLQQRYLRTLMWDDSQVTVKCLNVLERTKPPSITRHSTIVERTAVDATNQIIVAVPSQSAHLEDHVL